jgi:hypothetical protein
MIDLQNTADKPAHMVLASCGSIRSGRTFTLLDVGPHVRLPNRETHRCVPRQAITFRRFALSRRRAASASRPHPGAIVLAFELFRAPIGGVADHNRRVPWRARNACGGRQERRAAPHPAPLLSLHANIAFVARWPSEARARPRARAKQGPRQGPKARPQSKARGRPKRRGMPLITDVRFLQRRG